MNSTPPRSCLCAAKWAPTCPLISSSVTGLPPGLRTMNARGTSLPGMRGSGMPITAASRTWSCPTRTPSISAGAICKPLYLINSYNMGKHGSANNLERIRSQGMANLLPINNIKLPISVQADVSRTQPLISREGLRRRLEIVPVPHSHVGTMH